MRSGGGPGSAVADGGGALGLGLFLSRYDLVVADALPARDEPVHNGAEAEPDRAGRATI